MIGSVTLVIGAAILVVIVGAAILMSSVVYRFTRRGDGLPSIARRASERSKVRRPWQRALLSQWVLLFAVAIAIFGILSGKYLVLIVFVVLLGARAFARVARLPHHNQSDNSQP